MKMPAAEALRELSAVQAVKVKLGKGTLAYRMELKAQQERIFAACQVQLPPRMQIVAKRKDVTVRVSVK